MNRIFLELHRLDNGAKGKPVLVSVERIFFIMPVEGHTRVCGSGRIGDYLDVWEPFDTVANGVTVWTIKDLTS